MLTPPYFTIGSAGGGAANGAMMSGSNIVMMSTQKLMAVSAISAREPMLRGSDSDCQLYLASVPIWPDTAAVVCTLDTLGVMSRREGPIFYTSLHSIARAETSSTFTLRSALPRLAMLSLAVNNRLHVNKQSATRCT